MSELEMIALAGLVVFLCHLLERITGFGSTVVSLPFLTGLIGIRMAVPLLCVMSWVMAVYIVVRSWKAIAWKEYAFICFWVLLGDFLHYRVRELTFRKIVYGVLGVSGMVMLGNNLWKILLA